MRVSIIGGGIMGLSVARALLKKGLQVQLFEQATIPNPKGSSCDDHRLIRHPYGAHKGYLQMVDEAYATWECLWKDLGIEHYVQTGTLVTSRTGAGWAKDSLDALEEAGILLRILDSEELADYIPLLQFPELRLAYHLESGGVLFARRILASLKDYLLRKGVEIREHTKNHSYRRKPAADTYSIGGVQSFDHLIVTAGPWIKDLYPSLSVTPSQQTVYYLEVSEAEVSTWQQSQCF